MKVGMKYSYLIDEFHEYVSGVKRNFPDLMIDISRAYYAEREWNENQIPNAKQNGIYFITSQDNDLLYVGKTEQVDKKGLGKRSTEAAKKIMKKMANRKLVIYTCTVNPDYYGCLLEVFSLTLCRHTDGSIPEFNHKIC